MNATDAIRLQAYELCKRELPELNDHNGHPDMWAVEAVLQLRKDRAPVNRTTVLQLRKEIMPPEYTAALVEYLEGHRAD